MPRRGRKASVTLDFLKVLGFYFPQDYVRDDPYVLYEIRILC